MVETIEILMEENLELSEETKKELKKARNEPLSNYVDHEEVMKEFA